MIQVLICEGQAAVGEGFRAILSTVPGMKVVGVASDGEQAVQEVEQLHPDLVLMDLKMPRLNGIQATRQIHSRFPAVRVLALAPSGFDEWVSDALQAGACGYVLKGGPRAELVAAIEHSMAG